VTKPDIVKRLLKIAEEARNEQGDWNRQGRDQKPVANQIKPVG